MPDGYPLSYKNQTHLQNLRSVCKPYGIDVIDEVRNTKKCDFELKRTDKVGDAIVSYLKKHGLLVGDNENGDVVIRAPESSGAATDALEMGKNVLSGKQTLDQNKVFSQYVTVGQATNPLSELSVSANQLKAVQDYKGVKRMRANAIQVSGNATQTGLQKRAILQRDNSVGQADTIVYRVQGWHQSSGKLWKINQKVKISDCFLNINADYLISSVVLNYSGNGKVAEITCQIAKAFDNMAEQDDTAVKATDFSDVKAGSGRVGSAQWIRK